MEQLEPIPSTSMLGYLASGGMIVGGVIPYLPQYLEVKRTRCTDGFSLHVCLVLLIANILRIYFWVGKQFELPLLIQSIIMIATMLILVELSVRVNAENLNLPVKNRYFFDYVFRPREPDFEPVLVGVTEHKKEPPIAALNEAKNEVIGETIPEIPETHEFWDFDLNYFWRWTDFISYLEFLASFTVIIGIITYLFLDNVYYIEVLGFLAVFTEALLGAPQLYRNYVKKSTEGLSREMVLFWAIGDSFKTGYFFYNQTPIQFIICGALQLTIDALIGYQLLIYSGNPSPPRRHKK